MTQPRIYDSEDFNIEEVEENFRPTAVNPRISQMLTASYGYGKNQQEVRWCSTVDYDALTGSTRINKELSKEKQRLGSRRSNPILQPPKQQTPTGMTNIYNTSFCIMQRFSIFITLAEKRGIFVVEEGVRSEIADKGKKEYNNVNNRQAAREVHGRGIQQPESAVRSTAINRRVTR
ncbi:hypothetical protein EC973_002108 [Apophysomyces ossiformis]|uniref:Uncharacterized protein n=1 Tax=Apophysomyces ossiformis TaxID=679940 RepID=A0A8H7BJF8_9FUNG|nr:hypothetical protein EC973_002108 [Apophysomyces ossiformis]